MAGKRRDPRRDAGAERPQPIHPLLRLLPRAHRLMESGQHADAGQIFLDLGRKTEDRGLLRMAPFLYLQAGWALLLGGQVQDGVEWLQHGLSILQSAARWQSLERTSRLVCVELEQLGFPELALPIESWTRQALPPSFEPQQALPSLRGRLPLRCPTCQGVLKPLLVEILPDGLAECPYCGSRLILPD